jgi:hypothetical protein
MDLAKELNSVPSGASHGMGTMQFMAIVMRTKTSILVDILDPIPKCQL